MVFGWLLVDLGNEENGQFLAWKGREEGDFFVEYQWPGLVEEGRKVYVRFWALLVVFDYG